MKPQYHEDYTTDQLDPLYETTVQLDPLDEATVDFDMGEVERRLGEAPEEGLARKTLSRDYGQNRSQLRAIGKSETYFRFGFA